MNINWLKETSFQINTQKNKNGSVSILIDPFNEKGGLRAPKITADILLFDEENEKKKLPSIKNSFLVSNPGEYDMKNVYIQGIPAKTKLEGVKTVIYTIESEEIRICHLGKLGQEELSSEQIEQIGEVDILMVPIDGEESINYKEAAKIIAQIEPKITIPMNYSSLKQEDKSSGLDKFLKEFGIESLQPLPKLSIKKKDISKDEAKIIILEAQIT